jgi:chemotaxis protein histidine kinase CheA
MMPASALLRDKRRDDVSAGGRPSTQTGGLSTGSVANENIPDFDLGPLTWVRREIDVALTRACESLAAFCKREKDIAALHEARTLVHQVAGAIHMIGLDAAAEFIDEIERNLSRIEGIAGPQLEAAGAMIQGSCRKLSIFLRDVVSGAPPAALGLYPEYRAMRQARGVEATPSDLFYPDLNTKVPKAALREAIPAEKLHSHLARKRREYQNGLLAWLRGEEAGAKAMRDAVAGIECVTTKDSLRSFWWTVRALLEAMLGAGLEHSADLKQLVGRIDLQIRRVAEGGTEAADSLRREVLYYVALCAPTSPTVRAVQRAFGLARLIPPADAVGVDVIGIEKLVREARDRLVGIKQTWLSFASGRADLLPKVKQALTFAQAKAVETRHPTLVKLTAVLVDRLDRIPVTAIPDPLAMEFTTALLLAEDAFENLASLPPEFAQQVDTVLERLDATAAGQSVQGDAKMLGKLGERARDRLLLAQVGREIHANLRRMEDVLDTFFRDEAKRSELASLAKDLSQVRGALRILGLDGADRLLSLCDERIQAYASPETEVAESDLELLAESLCGLGFYFEQIELQRPGSERLLAPLLARWLGEPVRPPVEETGSVEASVAALRAELPPLIEAFRRDQNDANARGKLVATLARLRDDAELIGDQELATQAETAIAELKRREEQLAASIASAEPTAAVAEVTERLLEGGLGGDSDKSNAPPKGIDFESASVSAPDGESVPESTTPLAPVSESSAGNTPIDEAFTEPAAAPAPPVDSHHVALVHSASIESVAGVHDEIDDELLATFLGEADAFSATSAEKLREWRSAPHDEALADELGRTLHAFKAGARMAGAMRLGQLVQLMESQVLASRQRATSVLFDALDSDLELVAYMLDKLRAGETNVALPPHVPKSLAAPELAKPTEAPRPAQAPSAEHRAVTLADGGLRGLKANLLEVSNNMTRLRRQVREVEITTDIHIRSLMTELNGGRSHSDSSELDGFRRIRSLSQSLGEALNALAEVQQSLLRNVEEADGALPEQPRAVNAN